MNKTTFQFWKYCTSYRDDGNADERAHFHGSSFRRTLAKQSNSNRNKTFIDSQNPELKDKIKNKVKDKLSAHEYPRIIEFVSELPLTTTGKIKRNIIRENHLKENK